MPDPVEVLNSYAREFVVTPPAAPPATSPAFTFALTLPPGVPNIGALLPVTDVVRTVIESGSIDLTWITKDVRFVDTDITHNNLVGGMPVSDFILPAGLTPPNIGAATTGPTNPPGVPGLLGRVGGTIPLVLQRTERTQPPATPVRASVRWRIRDERGAIVPVTWSLAGGASGFGGEILQSLGTLPAAAPPSLTLTFPLLFTEMSTRALPLPRRTIEVAIRLEAATVGIATDWIDLPPVTITLPAIPIPRIAVFTENVDFGLRVLVVVPSGSPFTMISDVTTALNSLVTTLTPISGTPGLSVFLSQLAPTGLVMMSLNATAGTTNAIFQVADSMPFLRVAAWDRGWFGTNVVGAVNAEDSISAMALIGPPGSTMECFNAREFASHEGQINITTGTGLMTTVRDLGSAAPPCDPAGNISIPLPPGGWFPFHYVTTFGDELSSMRFV